LLNSSTFKDLWNEIQGFSSTCPVFKYFKALNLGEKIQVLSRTFKDAWEPCCSVYESLYHILQACATIWALHNEWTALSDWQQNCLRKPGSRPRWSPEAQHRQSSGLIAWKGSETVVTDATVVLDQNDLKSMHDLRFNIMTNLR